MEPQELLHRNIIHQKSSTLVDLHGMNRWKAKNTLERAILSLVGPQERSITVIHGYHQGTVLRDYLRSGLFANDLLHEYPLLPDIVIEERQPGITRIWITRSWYYGG